MSHIQRLALSFMLLVSYQLLQPASLLGWQQNPPSGDVWVSAYLASYNHYVPPGGNWGHMPTEAIDWDAFTHLFYFAFNVQPDGTLSKVAPYQNMNPDRLNSIVSAAHEAGKPVLFTIGGWGNHDQFTEAITPEKRPVLIQNLIQTLKTWQFDGIDLDLEPIEDADLENYGAFIDELHQELQSVQTPLLSVPLLTAAVNAQPEFFARVQAKFDQINLMTYDLSGAWGGWVSWHNAAVYSSRNFPYHDKPLPSTDRMVKEFLSAGIPASKLGIGIDFYGYVWSGGSGTSTRGVTRPNQSWIKAPKVTDNVPFHKIMDEYAPSGSYSWDDEAKAAYLSIDRPGSADDLFISFDDEQSIRAKFEYVEENKLGGVIIWELTGGYRANLPPGQRDLLLQAVKDVANEHTVTNTSYRSPTGRE